MDRIIRPILYLLTAGLLLMAWSVQAKIEVPDHIYYGSATIYGNPVPAGTVVEARSDPDGVLLSRYTVGSNSHMGNYYKLPIPLDTVDPRKPGMARIGDPIRIFVDGQLAAKVSVGLGEVKGVGSTTRLDVDPQNMGTGPAIWTENIAVVEGNAGTTDAVVPVRLSTSATRAVEIQWETRDGTAVGGARCNPGVDFIHRAGTPVKILAGALTGAITVQICGDTEVEPNEEFSVVLLSTTDNFGVFTPESTATVTIVDDDDVPTLQVGSIRVAEPPTATVTARFVAQLSRSHSEDVSFHWATQDGTARAGSDYISTSGDVTIKAGDTHAHLDVTVLADSVVEPDETFRVLLSNPVSLALSQTQAWATIVDPQHDPAVTEEGAVTGEDVPDLSKPSAISLSPDGSHAYAVSGDKGAVLHFQRDPATGLLANPVSYKTSTGGFENAKLSGLQDIKLSADGGFVYVAAMGSNAITVLARDSNSGALTFVESVAQGGGVEGLNKPHRLVISPDANGAQVYVLGRDSNSVVTFQRDPATGKLGYVGNINPQTATIFERLLSPSGIAVSPDGAQVYVTARMGNALFVLDRNSNTTSADFGKLTMQTSLANGIHGLNLGLKGAFGVAVSGDGRNVYVAAEADNALSTFDRAADGSLVLSRVITHGDTSVFGLRGPKSVAVAPNGKEVFVTAFSPDVDGSDSLSVFKRSGDGRVSILRSVFKGDSGLSHLDQPGAMALSGDDRFVYVAASGGNSAIVVYHRTSAEVLFQDGFEDTP